jgi:hypothetical protein
MPDFCTCGAELPPDALFCHKCGKPQREITVEEPAAPITDAGPVPASPPFVTEAAQPEKEIKFHGGLAVRVAAPVAIGATLLSFLPYINWIAAGFFAVFFYKRRTGQPLAWQWGVRIGWTTGLLMFVLLALMLAGSLALINAAGGIESVQAQLRNTLDPNVLQVLKTLESRPEMIKLLIQLFLMVNVFSMAGGALGARLAGRR